jgi:hypothetical protein
MKDKYPVRNPDIVDRKEEKEALLFNPADGNMVCINGTGIFVWDLADGGHSIGDMVKRVTEKYEVPSEEAEKDCLKYLKELEEAGFIGYKV